jgi:hypothetical protein
MTSRRIQRRLEQVTSMCNRLGYPDHLQKLRIELLFRSHPSGIGRTQEMRDRKKAKKVRHLRYISEVSRRANRRRK